MENLTIHDQPPPGGLQQGDLIGRAPPQPQQLPPQMFTTAAQLLDLTDNATETSQLKGYYADTPHGIFLVRGENVLLLGEIDLDKDDEPPVGFEKAEFKMVEKLVKERKAADKAKEKTKLKKLATLGFEGDHQGEILL